MTISPDAIDLVQNMIALYGIGFIVLAILVAKWRKEAYGR